MDAECVSARERAKRGRKTESANQRARENRWTQRKMRDRAPRELESERKRHTERVESRRNEHIQFQLHSVHCTLSQGTRLEALLQLRVA